MRQANHAPLVYAPGMLKAFALIALLAACGGPSRSTYARHPGAPAAFDRTTANPEALAIADKVLAAHGGAEAWDKAKQIRWKQQIVTEDGKIRGSGEQAWDRWNARHWGKIDRADQPPVAVMYALYGDFVAGYMEMSSGNRQAVPTGEAKAAAKVARDQWQRDTTSMFAPFLLHEPGSKLEYAGIARAEDGREFHDLKLTFDPKDTARAGMVVHVYVDKEKHQVHRVELELANGEKYAYEMTAYTTAGGLQLPTERKNLGSNEVIKATDFKISEPDDMLFAPAPLI